ncbi:MULTISPECIES: TMEM165/GDT1 family protein [unclassified Pseudanabaena]|uniref:TMEM165/GDT1 family protein n=1 Tax=unclassified Pseudanabaena TaxID=2593292 RepID=UPI0006D7D019|nr:MULTISPECIES: TMEM165/GDT1 family protein [unclassified Pseudanabaena]TYQ27922.1 TMEM165/GDT1 family protein [Pseudanabaena sp. UWO310]
MDWQLLFLSFGTIFLSELGDKSQLATLSLSGSSAAPKYVFIGSAAALLVASSLGVWLGDSISILAPTRLLKAIGAALFAFMAMRLFMSDSSEH